VLVGVLENSEMALGGFSSNGLADGHFLPWGPAVEHCVVAFVDTAVEVETGEGIHGLAVVG